MFRYFSIIWPRDSRAAEATAALVRKRLLAAKPDWRSVFSTSGAEIYCAGIRPGSGNAMILHHQQGAIIGTLFPARSSSPIRNLDPASMQRIVATRGSSLISTHWGSYVLFLKPSTKDDMLVLRGPMAAIPCFWTTLGETTLLFSEVHDSTSIGLLPYSINWDCIRAQAVGGDYLGKHTALSELRQLVSGECLNVRGETRVSHTYWAPSTIPTWPAALDLKSSATLLRQATHTCVQGWASLHHTCLVRLSGGLDSSIVLACARQRPVDTKLVCAHFWSGGPADERKYARSMAKAMAVELVELKRDSDVDLRRFLTCSLTGNPPIHFTAFDEEPRLIALAKEREATAILTGEIGDDIFGHAPFAGCAFETLQSTGMGRTFARAVVDYATLNQLSLWKVLSQVIRYRRFLRSTKHFTFYRLKALTDMHAANTLASREIVLEYETSLLSRDIHPWMHNVRELPSGSLMLIWSLITATSTWLQSPFGGADGDLFITPLASQPLVEAFWKIPSRFHFYGGETAAVARTAFATELTADILNRGTSKGTPGLWAQEVISRNRSFVRDVLLDGILSEQRILDRKKIEDALSGDITNSQIVVADILIQLYIECWLRGWTEVARKAVA